MENSSESMNQERMKSTELANRQLLVLSELGYFHFILVEVWKKFVRMSLMLPCYKTVLTFG